ncbi:MAG: histone deacetylase [Terriglobia bacterium]|jgi:acetoin utilization deacetylase AcuC-like enzyme|nr:histone deacetylase [Terriglobia bacterium]
MLPFKLVYGQKYDLPIGAHIFPSAKYKLICRYLLEQNLISEDDIVAPNAASDEDVLLVHTPMYVHKLKTGTLSAREELELEVPYSKELVDAFWTHAGGSVLAAELALRDGVCVNVGGGFHHAFPDHGEGFCVLNDVAIVIRKMQKEGRITRAMTVDCDVHQGNGTAAIFGGAQEPFPPPPAWSAGLTMPRRPAHMEQAHTGDVFTISLHQENNYPVWKPPSSIDVNLPDGTDDDEYLEWLDKALGSALDQHEPELLVYVAGADPYREDQLGGLGLTIDGLRRRDETVFRFARKNSIPVMATLAGGYARQLLDTVRIHANTIVAAKQVFT